MKRILGLLAVLAVTVVMSSSAFAAIEERTIIATADFATSGTADFSFTLKNVDGDAAATAISWGEDAFNVSSTTAWVRAKQYAVVAATITKAGYNVYMYQTNTKSTGVYKATSTRTNGQGTAEDPHTHVYSGLVRSGSNGGEYRGYIPLAYSYVPTKQPTIEFNGTTVSSKTRADRYFTDRADLKADKTTSNFDENYAKIAGLVGPVFGVDAEDGDWTGEVVNNTAYMYFFGGFANIIGGDVYGTDQIQVKQTVE